MLSHNGDVICDPMNGVNNTSGQYFASKCEHSVRDVEMLRLIGQYLCDKGLNGAYAQLSKESGISLEHIDATELRHATLEGRWIDAEAAVDRLVPLIGDPSSAEEVRFLLLEQRFLEHLEANEVMPAVMLLRNRITPMQRNTERVHTLASCLMCRTNAELRAQAGGWAGKDNGSRLQLIDRIQAFVPAQTMLPPRRLEELISDSVRAQLTSCIFHNPPVGSTVDLNEVSLLQRHSCGMYNFPAFCTQSLQQRDGELWLCQFSPDGAYLAVGGKDPNVDVLRVDAARHSVSPYRVLSCPSYMSSLCWSPDSKKLAACCGEDSSCVYVFDVVTGQQLCQHKVADEETYSSATFFPDSRKLAFGGLKGVFYVMDVEDQGRILTSVEGYRIQSMAAIPRPAPRIVPQANLDEIKLVGGGSSSDLTAPGGPDALIEGTTVEPARGTDQLLIADSLHRIRLFRFGSLENSGVAALQPPSSEASESSAPPGAASTEEATLTAIGSTSQSPSNPADLTIYLTSSGAPGSPGTTLAFAGGSAMSVSGSSGTSSIPTADLDNPSIVAALTVARLSRQQQRLLQSGSASSGGHSVWSQQAYGPASMQASAASFPPSSAALPPIIPFDMPILPVSLSRLGSSQGTQTPAHSGIRPPLGVTPYTVVSSSSGSNVGASPGSSLTILFGPPLERSSSATYSSSAATSAEVRALLAAAALRGSNPHSLASLVPSLSSIVATSSPSADAGGRTMTTTTDTSMGPLVTTTVSGGTTASGEVPSVTGGAAPASNSYGLIDHRTLFKEVHGVQSITMSRSGQRALITIHKMGLHLWDVEACAVVQRFIGYKQDTFRLTSTFGGAEEQFVATGSEDGRIHIWQTSGGNHPIFSAPTPSISSNQNNQDAVTCVHWNPAVPTMLACVNDAGVVYIWGPQRYLNGAGQPMDDSG